MKIFITGESGTITKQIIKQAKHCGWEIMNEKIDSSLKRHNSFKIRDNEVDFCDKELLLSLVHIWEQTDIIIHSGAFVGTDYCAVKPEDTIRTNVQGTQNIVDIANMFNIKLIYFSTTAIFDVTKYGREELITESTDKNPKTLYGITKYTGEMIVERTCKTDKTILRPVFGFGDFPDDLHSAMTKLIYNYVNDCDLNILLNRKIEKTYTRVENIAAMTLNTIAYHRWNNDYNIGDKWDNSYDWFEYMEMIEKKFNNKGLTLKNTAQWIEDEDYLQWHQISTVKAERDGIWECPVSLSDGLDLTIKSVLNSNIKPYWITK